VERRIVNKGRKEKREGGEDKKGRIREKKRWEMLVGFGTRSTLLFAV